MYPTKQHPTVTVEEGATGGERYRHPAFGEISVTKGSVSNGGVELFGSDLKHRNVLTITIRTASSLRLLNRDWISSDRDVVSFQMSESQWASFVSAQGGMPVPITFERRPTDDFKLEMMPGIESRETAQELFDREVRERAEGYLQASAELVERLQAALEEGKANKDTLKELMKLATTLNTGMPNSMSFIREQMSKTMEKIVTSGKIEMEAFVNDLAQRKGLEAMKDQPVMMLASPSSQDKQDS
ncbi:MULTISPECIES: hypothetical protein [Pseudomonadaceae]|uniref:hypothetical protein n=1 Tax=Pseudomonadaceae TaxID=135621 RepID=UPI0015E3B890|nr:MULTISPECIES: hypothetical protein [Pseudomonadaceae]MBA1280471.1 hypothetical protein [Stutzerimonas stutzeri]MBH8610679.1 hypothetical protein [Pseudomonas mohnii]